MNRYQMLSALLAGTLFAGMAGLALPASPADDTEKAESEDAIDWNKEREFWSFRQPVARPQPVVKNNRCPTKPRDNSSLARSEQPTPVLALEPAGRRSTRRAPFNLPGRRR